MRKIFGYLLLSSFAILLNSSPVQAQCNSQFVSEVGGTLIVSPTGDDDTANIRCALEEARDQGFPSVKLQQADYFVTTIEIEGFEGTFEGTTRSESRLLFFNSGVDCSAYESGGQISAGIKFIEGEPRVRFMTIAAERPCQEGASAFQFNLLHFTGQPSGSGCDFDVIFGEVDRVDFFGPGRGSSRLRGVSASPEGTAFGGCKDRLLGTMKVNRSTFTGLQFGVITGLKGNAQVDVRFNEFSDFTSAVFVIEASQDLAIAQNRFLAIDSSQEGAITIGWSTTPSSPNSNRLVIHGNDIFFSDSINQGSTSIFVSNIERLVNSSVLISQNHFDMSGSQGVAISGIDVSDGQVSANRFTGRGFAAVLLGTENRQVTGWSLVGNNFGAFSSTNSGQSDVNFLSGTRNNIFGPAQGARIADFGSNFVLGATPTGKNEKAVNSKESAARALFNRLQEDLKD